ncbi:MAG TPA: DnaD domain protein [Anaerolineaceae bacterium]|nr:DnaD domain protein [Anaerolineaceae bacterium]HOU43647.1 DnaD domain protein [Anaerolineaceae bacterium]HQJ02978.1 DnaD domain protein [Anaerolineaceae bacterium]HQL38651.1 DnaD domain protein [Anaerolineaceae bacterium]
MPFAGFSSSKTRTTPLPEAFFAELLPQVDDLGELKVTLYAFWHLSRQEGSLRYLTGRDFAEDSRLLEGLPGGAEALPGALDRAVRRGTLLRAQPAQGETGDSLYFLNTPRGRAAYQGLLKGTWQPEDGSHPEIRLELERPNIFRLYEENIGPLTPLIADILRDAEQTYPAAWIEDALRQAVQANARNWRYVEAILRRRMERGTSDGKHPGESEKDRHRYVEGEFGDYIEH